MEYGRRIVDDELDELMSGLAAIVLEGPRGVGKTTTAARRAAITFELDDPAQREILAAEPSQLDAAPGTVLVDEWQHHTPIWDYVRRSVDAGAPPGRFLLAGSAAPTEAPAHSGAGRIVGVRMRPLSLAERGLGTTTVSLARLLEGGRPALGGRSGVALDAYAAEIVASGFPAVRPLAGRLRRAQLDAYVARVVAHDFPDQGLRVRRPAALRGWLEAYAAATATTASYNALLDAATPGETDKPSRITITGYREVLFHLWLLDPLTGWLPGGTHLRRLTQAPKHHLADPGLAAHLLGVDEEALLRGRGAGSPLARGPSLFGALFESLVALSMRIYAQAGEATVHHLRTKNGDHEVDLVVQRRNQRVVALEVKLGAVPDAADVRHLHWLQEQLGDDLLDAIVVTTGERAYRRPDGIGVVPAALLGP